MARIEFIYFVCIFLLVETHDCLIAEEFKNQNASLWSQWRTVSDSETHSGESTASFITRPFRGGQVAVLFTMLVPCHRNASFAGIVRSVSLDISQATNIVLNVRNQGEYHGYEFVIRHHGDAGDSVPSYATYFKAPKNNFEEVVLPIDGFQAYRQGKAMSDAPPLNKKNITAVGLLAYGGSHRPEKQVGVAALEIASIRFE